MLSKLKNCIALLVKKRGVLPTGKIMKWIAWYIAIILLSTFLYLIGWGVLWHMQGTPDITELRAFLHEIVSAPWIAMVGVIAQYFVDKNRNSIPDTLENPSYRPIPPQRIDRKMTPPTTTEKETQDNNDTRGIY